MPQEDRQDPDTTAPAALLMGMGAMVLGIALISFIAGVVAGTFVEAGVARPFLGFLGFSAAGLWLLFVSRGVWRQEPWARVAGLSSFLGLTGLAIWGIYFSLAVYREDHGAGYVLMGSVFWVAASVTGLILLLGWNPNREQLR